MKLSAKSKKILMCALFTVLALAIVAGLVTLNQAYMGGRFDKLYYEIESSDRKLEYSLVEVLRERDEPPVYKVEINGKTINVSETIWETYLGDDYNTITYHTETISIYKIFLSDTYDSLDFSRGNYPWEDPAQPYSEADALLLLAAIYEQDCWDRPFHRGHRLFQSDTAVTFDTSGYGHGGAKDSYAGKTPLEHPEINWWWTFGNN